MRQKHHIQHPSQAVFLVVVLRDLSDIVGMSSDYYTELDFRCLNLLNFLQYPDTKTKRQRILWGGGRTLALYIFRQSFYLADVDFFRAPTQRQKDNFALPIFGKVAKWQTHERDVALVFLVF